MCYRPSGNVSGTRGAALRLAALGGALALVGCPGGTGPGGGSGGGEEQEPAPAYAATVAVVDELGSPVPAAACEVPALGFTSQPVDGAGKLRLTRLRGPVLVVASAPGFLPGPVVIDPELAGAEVPVRLLARRSAGGEERIALHFGGDVMLGRRYLAPTSPITAVVTPGDGGASARAVVASLGPLFRAADLRSLNLETVVGELPASAAYPKKRFLLQSPPETMAMLDELQTSLVTLGNNHMRDWLEPGVVSTIAALDAAGIPHVGGGVSQAEARVPLAVAAGGLRVGCLSYTSVNGDFVNDSLPGDAAPVPSPLPSQEAWQYDARSFGYTGPSVTIPAALRRIGGLWGEFRAVEDDVATETELADLWAQASGVYPELQDWVARRGHGGANYYSTGGLAADIAELRAGGADLVVVQYHSGFQFVEVKSEFLEGAAHRAIDLGADLVVCHHPHVLQGLEWYRGKLIAYSLGNFIFDQDFLSTFSSAMLRVVFEGQELIEARVYPLVLERYRPVPLGGAAARNVIQALAERSTLPWRSERIDGAVRTVLSAFPAEAEPPRFVLEGSSARLERGAVPRATVSIDLPAGAMASIEPPTLTRSRGPGGAALSGVLFGRDLFRWGDFEDHAADGEDRGGAHWLATQSYKRVEVFASAASGTRCLRLSRTDRSRSRITTRPVARVPLGRHRVYDASGGSAMPADGEATFSLRLSARLDGAGHAFVRLDVYHFDDTNPTEDPESLLIRQVELAIDVPPDEAWHLLTVDLPASALEPAGPLAANAVLLNVGLGPEPGEDSVLRVDDLQVIEWRAADEMPDGFYAVDVIRSMSGAPQALVVEQCQHGA
jgi:poly-gamma-glutamate capsule biosynthesis protein CapA/YwtB (metallophosphatase superfamily)